MSNEIFPDRADWIRVLAAAARRPAPVPDASPGTPKAPLRPRTARKVPKIEQSITSNRPKEIAVETKIETQRAASHPVEERVARLRGLLARVADRYLELACALYKEHLAELWTKAPASGGGHFESEAAFFEEGVGIKIRTAQQLIAVGGVLAKVPEQAEASEALSGVGMFKLDVITPVLKRDPVLPTIRKWAELARTHSRAALRELVAKSLDRKLRDPEAPGERFKKYILNQVPPDARIIAEEFFDLGERVVESENAIAILLAGMTECLSTWAAHSKAGVDAEAGKHAA